MSPKKCIECDGFIIYDKDLETFTCKNCGLVYNS